MLFEEFKTVRVTGPDEYGVLTVTLNRPDARNAVNLAMHDELLSVATALRNHPTVGAVLFTGAGDSFCAGGDMQMFDRLATDVTHRDQMTGDGLEMVQSWLQIRPPVVVAVQGHAMGLGATLALLSDIVYLGESAQIADTHVRAGLVAGDGGALIWPALIGANRAKEFLMTGGRLDAHTALGIGLANHVVADDRLQAEAASMAQRLAQGPRNAVAWTKQAINAALLREAATLLPLTIAMEARTMAQPDMVEGTRAFLEKRSPRWPSVAGVQA